MLPSRDGLGLSRLRTHGRHPVAWAADKTAAAVVAGFHGVCPPEIEYANYCPEPGWATELSVVEAETADTQLAADGYVGWLEAWQPEPQ